VGSFTDGQDYFSRTSLISSIHGILIEILMAWSQYSFAEECNSVR